MSTTNITGVELFQTGIWNGDAYDIRDLNAMVRASQETGFTPPVKIGHMSDEATNSLLKHEGLPAFGWIKNLRVQGEKLLGDLVQVPRRIADLIKAGAYKRLSAEIFWNYTQGTKTWPRVLKAVSLLGAEIPAVTNLKELEALYAITNGGADHGYRLNLQYGASCAKERTIMRALRYDDATLSDSDRAAIDRATAETPAQKVDRLTRSYAATHPGLDYKQAMKAVLDQDPELKIQYAGVGTIFKPGA